VAVPGAAAQLAGTTPNAQTVSRTSSDAREVMPHPDRPTALTRHFFTVDVEEYFQVNAFESVIPRDDWDRWPRRLEHNLPPLLDLLARYDAKGTFFTLGWVADRMPHLVRAIVDGGHELASHGYWHRRVVTLSPAQFRDDLIQSKQSLENAGGTAVMGFRAPSFSIIPGYEWAYDVLLDAGFRYDSSAFPIHRPGYGSPNAPRIPHVMQRPAGRLAEYPLATTSVLGYALPAAGGGYLRQFPFALIRRAFADATARGIPSTFYIHPWEIDPAQPRVPVPWLTRVRHYRGLSTTLERIERLLKEFSFTTIASSLDSTFAPAS
jgi:polysaccharide deacetylase family protein (PEP-CTERM system associated)